MKNHEWVDGKLLQTNKKYSQLKLKQKEKIYQWMYEAYRDKYREFGKYPDLKDIDESMISWNRSWRGSMKRRSGSLTGKCGSISKDV